MDIKFVLGIVFTILYFIILAIFSILAGVYKSKCKEDSTPSSCTKETAFMIVAIILAVPILFIGAGLGIYKYH